MAISQAKRSRHSAQSRAPQPASPNPAAPAVPKPQEAPSRIERLGKRTTSITVKMSAEDYALLQKAAGALWPGALLSNSSIVLGLGRMGADAVLKKSEGRPQ
jgi:hypothetical protein